MKEYLSTLIPSKKWFEHDPPLKVGDLVLVMDNNIERNQWLKGIVTRVFPASDNEVRLVSLKTVNGPLERPSRKLVRFLEV